MGAYQYCKIVEETKIAKQIAIAARPDGQIKIVEVRVELGNDFSFSLYSGLSEQKLVRTIERPNDGDRIPINEVIGPELVYRLILGDTRSAKEKPFSLTVVYEFLYRHAPAIEPLKDI